MYLNESKSYKNVLIFICRTTSFIACIPIRHFLAIMPWPKNFKTDFGGEFGIWVSAGLSRYNIIHSGKLPNRSDQQGAAEVSIKLVKALFHKLCSLTVHSGRNSWVSLNASHYKSPLSRSSLFFSPFHYSNPGLVLEDSFLLQRNTLDSLNIEKIKNLKNKNISKDIFPFRQGNFVLLKLDIKGEC